MNDEQRSTAARCAAGAEAGSMTFPEIVGLLAGVGIESYTVDFRRATATYYLPDGDHTEFGTYRPKPMVADVFDTGELTAAIRDAQQLVDGYTYPGFCDRIAAAGCAGYTVSLLGKRAVYAGRTAETHTERFPT